MEKLDEYPDQDGYAIQPAQVAILNTDLDGGLPRTRLDMFDESRIVNLKWTCDFKRFEKIVKFFGDNLGRNREPFLIDLHASHSNYEEYVARLMADSLQLVGMDGHRKILAASFEVTPNFLEYVGSTCLTDSPLPGVSWPDSDPNDLGWFAPTFWNDVGSDSAPDPLAEGVSSNIVEFSRQFFYAGVIVPDIQVSDVIAWNVEWAPIDPDGLAYPPAVTYANSNRTIIVDIDPDLVHPRFGGVAKITATINGKPIPNYLSLAYIPNGNDYGNYAYTHHED